MRIRVRIIIQYSVVFTFPHQYWWRLWMSIQ